MEKAICHDQHFQPGDDLKCEFTAVLGLGQVVLTARRKERTISHLW